MINKTYVYTVCNNERIEERSEGMDCSKIKVVKGWHKEDFNIKKVILPRSVNQLESWRSTFQRAEKNFICEFVEEKGSRIRN